MESWLSPTGMQVHPKNNSQTLDMVADVVVRDWYPGNILPGSDVLEQHGWIRLQPDGAPQLAAGQKMTLDQELMLFRLRSCSVSNEDSPPVSTLLERGNI